MPRTISEMTFLVVGVYCNSSKVWSTYKSKHVLSPPQCLHCAMVVLSGLFRIGKSTVHWETAVDTFPILQDCDGHLAERFALKPIASTVHVYVHVQVCLDNCYANIWLSTCIRVLQGSVKLSVAADLSAAQICDFRIKDRHSMHTLQ
jgi:hypothetical protein